jgi:hypothetical protein
MSDRAARQVAAAGHRYWRTAKTGLHIAMPNTFFDKLGVPRLAP